MLIGDLPGLGLVATALYAGAARLRTVRCIETKKGTDSPTEE
jgi:hypothetical protein